MAPLRRAINDRPYGKHRRRTHDLRVRRMVSMQVHNRNERPGFDPSDLWGSKPGNYVAAAVVLTVIRLIGVISDLFFSSGKSFAVMDKLATIIVDTTSLIMMADLTVSAIKIRRLFPTVAKRRS